MTQTVEIEIVSFGYRHGPAPQALFTLDVRRDLRDPLASAALRNLTGLDRLVVDHVARTPVAGALVDGVLSLIVDTIDCRVNGDREPVRLDLAIGCAGGRHRSVTLAEMIGERLTAAGYGRVSVVHRDIDRPVLASA